MLFDWNIAGLPLALLTICVVIGIGYLAWDRQQKKKVEIERIYRIENLRGRIGDNFTDMLIKRSIAIGMNSQMVELAWGKPNTVDKQEITKTGISKQRWVYGIPRKNAKYIYFKNDMVEKIQM